MSAPTPAPVSRSRVAVVDALRGFVMVVMALDHTRDFLSNSVVNPLDPQHTTFLLYFTRWITHLCAPVFVFLAGTSIFLQQQRKDKSTLTRLLLTRGLWLVFVELTLVHFAFNFHWQWNVQILEVIWVIGASMMCMAALIHLGVRGNLIFGGLLVLGHNAFDRVMPPAFGSFGWIWQLLHVPGSLLGPPTGPPIVIVAYPLIPWVGVMALGYAFGSLVLRPAEQRRRFEWRAGVVMLAVFGLLRWSNLYGDPVPWSAQANWGRTLLSFFNVQKYPPSLLFVLATLGTAALILTVLDFNSDRFKRIIGILDVYGRVPLFYFLLHFTLIHFVTLVLTAVAGGNWHWWLAEIPNGGILTSRLPGFGFGLGTIWLIWILVVVSCYPACVWYAGVKGRGRHPLLSYL